MYNTLFYLTLTKNYWKLTNITIIKNFATKSMQKINRKKIRLNGKPYPQPAGQCTAEQ